MYTYISLWRIQLQIMSRVSIWCELCAKEEPIFLHLKRTGKKKEMQIEKKVSSKTTEDVVAQRF